MENIWQFPSSFLLVKLLFLERNVVVEGGPIEVPKGTSKLQALLGFVEKSVDVHTKNRLLSSLTVLFIA